MGTFDPERKTTGPPAIASHYHPLIGPYDSIDPDVLEYHALLMKLAGIDGVILDWYGTADALDYALIQRNAGAFADQAARTGLAFAICYEDRSVNELVKRGRLDQAARVEHARRELQWLSTNWFDRRSYLKVAGKPVFLSFGQDGLSESEWSQVLADWSGAVVYLSEHHRRPAAQGAFDWPVPQLGHAVHENFYKAAVRWPVAMAVAYPRFHDIYEQARVHKSWGRISDNDGDTFVVTIRKALESGLPLVQICTWNDWGEGTMIEPSVEFGYRDLEVVQRLRRQFVEPGFAGKPEDLRLAHRVYLLRKATNKPSKEARELDQAARLLTGRSIQQAREMLDRIQKLPRAHHDQPTPRKGHGQLAPAE
jgi:hypothetical protein